MSEGRGGEQQAYKLYSRRRVAYFVDIFLTGKLHRQDEKRKIDVFYSSELCCNLHTECDGKKNLSFARSLINLSNKMWLDLSSRAVEAADLTPSHFTKIYKQQERKIIIYLLRLLYYFFVNVVHKQAKKHFTDSKKFKFNEAKNIPKKKSRQTYVMRLHKLVSRYIDSSRGLETSFPSLFDVSISYETGAPPS